MKRVVLSISILISLILLCIISLTELKIQCREYLTLIDNLQSAVDSGNTEQSLKAFDNLENGWKHYHNITGIFVNGNELDSVREIMSGLRPLLEEEHPEVNSELEKMRMLITSIYEEELPELWHIL